MTEKQSDPQGPLSKKEGGPGYWDQRYHIIIKMFSEIYLKLTHWKSTFRF